MKMAEIFNQFIHPLVIQYIKYMNLPIKQKETLMKYINFIHQRSNGKNKTDASKIRQFITEHPKYGRNSIITNEICYDLMRSI